MDFESTSSTVPTHRQRYKDISMMSQNKKHCNIKSGMALQNRIEIVKERNGRKNKMSEMWTKRRSEKWIHEGETKVQV